MAIREGLSAENRISIKWSVNFSLSFLQKNREKYHFQMRESEDDENFKRFKFEDILSEQQIISDAGENDEEENDLNL